LSVKAGVFTSQSSRDKLPVVSLSSMRYT